MLIMILGPYSIGFTGVFSKTKDKDVKRENIILRFCYSFQTSELKFDELRKASSV